MIDTAPRRGLDLHWKILIGLAAGAMAGLAAHALLAGDARLEAFTRNVAEPVGQVFLRLILMVVIPLVFSALVLGVAGLGGSGQLGRLGLRTLVFTVVLSSISVVIGLGAVNLVQPGTRLPEEKRQALTAEATESAQGRQAVEDAKTKTLKDLLLDVIPRNPIQEMAGALDGSSPGGGMLAVMFFALIVGVAVARLPERTGPLVELLQGVFDVSMFVIGLAMRLAPIGVAALVFSLTSLLGFDILRTLAWYVATVVAALALHQFGVYSLAVRFAGGMSLRRFFGGSSDAMLTAFGTSSSNATLPTSLRVAQESLGVRPEVARFVLTVGATANQNGTALYEGITVLFLAQVYGIDLAFGQQVTVLLLAILAGIGTAGVPGGSLPLVVMVLLSVGIPAEGIGIILGVDRLLDMCRTTVNVTGDLAVAVCVDGPAERPTA